MKDNLKEFNLEEDWDETEIEENFDDTYIKNYLSKYRIKRIRNKNFLQKNINGLWLYGIQDLTIIIWIVGLLFLAVVGSIDGLSSSSFFYSSIFIPITIIIATLINLYIPITNSGDTERIKNNIKRRANRSLRKYKNKRTRTVVIDIKDD